MSEQVKKNHQPSFLSRVLRIEPGSSEYSPLTLEQISGLNEVGFGFTLEIEPKSLRQQIIEAPYGYFGHVNPSEALRTIVPGFYQGAINPHLNGNTPALPNSNNLSLDDQLQIVEEYARKLRRERIKGTLTDIEFVVEHAPVYSQLDIAYKKETGEKLLVAMLASTVSPTTVGSNVANVGRDPDHDRLYVFDWDRYHGDPWVWAVPVARPSIHS